MVWIVIGHHQLGNFHYLLAPYHFPVSPQNPLHHSKMILLSSAILLLFLV